MRTVLTTLLFSQFILISFSQTRIFPSDELLNKSEPYITRAERVFNQNNENIPGIKYPWYSVDEETVGNTYYDLQTQASISTRIVNYEDNTKGIVFTRGMDYPICYDRGTGYNYFNGVEWDEWPESALESQRSGWPAYQQYGENGEVNVAHISGGDDQGLLFNLREIRFQGEWNEFLFQGPAGFEFIIFPRLATGGVDHSVIHLLAQIQNPNNTYMDIYYPPLYSRSTDGGITWEVENVLLDELSSLYYSAFDFDQFNLIAKGNNVAILYGDLCNDLGLLKSEDGGNTWNKSIIWEHPYPFINNIIEPTDTFYCVDGSHHLAFDSENKIHVVFGISRAYATYGITFWFPAVDGIGYWNEDRPPFSNDLNALNPYGHPDSELEEDYSLIGWTQDINNNGTLDIIGNWGEYYLGFSSMPQICFSNYNELYVIYSSVTETFNNGLQDYRHLWIRSSFDGYWWGGFVDLTNDLTHIFDECVFPSVAERVDEIHLVYQLDTEPGLAVWGDEDPWGENFINYMKIDFYTGVEENNKNDFITVSQNQPNPFRETSTVYVKLLKTSSLILEITNMMGQVVYRTDKGKVPPGLIRLAIDGSRLPKGVYYYTVIAGDTRLTRKMIKE
ncbi:MAG: T9SS type A sorting domain-containing protein [Bacteroidales bacterium]|nr:T9SS type A sorting domain-containing protein [Bacteroidales bacterium]